jgi:transposase
MLKLHLTQIEALEGAVADVERRITEAVAPFRAAVSLLITMPGLSGTAAAVIVAEIGDTMAVFPTAGHLVSWAGLGPRLDESAGSTRTRQGGRRGSKPPSYKRPGPPPAKRTAIFTPSFSG